MLIIEVNGRAGQNLQEDTARNLVGDVLRDPDIVGEAVAQMARAIEDPRELVILGIGKRKGQNFLTISQSDARRGERVIGRPRVQTAIKRALISSGAPHGKGRGGFIYI